jgi:hypothetical protein
VLRDVTGYVVKIQSRIKVDWNMSTSHRWKLGGN